MNPSNITRTVSYTVDVETDWGGRLPAAPEHIRGIAEALPRIGTLLEEQGVRATLFVSGEVAGHAGAALRGFIQRGHEIAAHGYTHRHHARLHGAALREDLIRSREALEDICGTAVRGFRAPRFSLSPESFELLGDAGYAYDSSVLVSSPPQPAAAYRIGTLVEIPLARLPLLRLQPGLLWIRLIGIPLYRALMARARMRSHVVYLHPFDFIAAAPARTFGPLVNLWYCRSTKGLYEQLAAIVSCNRTHGRQAVLMRDLHSRFVHDEAAAL
jgi:hypothetical protein